MAWYVTPYSPSLSFFAITFFHFKYIEFLDVQELMNNLEINTNYWKDQCDKPKPLLQQQQQQQHNQLSQQQSSTDETIKEDSEENEQY
jgi:hypothetical protein